MKRPGPDKLLLLLISLTLLFIWSNSAMSREVSSGMSNGLLELLRPVLAFVGIEPESDHLLRKLAHFCEFFALGFELRLYFLLKGKKRTMDIFSCAFLSFAAATIDETIQFFSGRDSKFMDVLLDFSGAVTAIVFISIACYVHKKLKEKRSDA